jgi:hypothetical protein
MSVFNWFSFTTRLVIEFTSNVSAARLLVRILQSNVWCESDNDSEFDENLTTPVRGKNQSHLIATSHVRCRSQLQLILSFKW